MKLEKKFIRTYDGNIAQINILDKENNPLIICSIKGKGYMASDIKKSSYNIIDLIEVGDIAVDNSGRKLEVNLIRVWNDVKEIICNDYNLDDSAITLHNGGIFKVLTHEQFENYCFRIGE